MLARLLRVGSRAPNPPPFATVRPPPGPLTPRTPRSVHRPSSSTRSGLGPRPCAQLCVIRARCGPCGDGRTPSPTPTGRQSARDKPPHLRHHCRTQPRGTSTAGLQDVAACTLLAFGPRIAPFLPQTHPLHHHTRAAAGRPRERGSPCNHCIPSTSNVPVSDLATASQSHGFRRKRRAS